MKVKLEEIPSKEIKAVQTPMADGTKYSESEMRVKNGILLFSLFSFVFGVGVMTHLVTGSIMTACMVTAVSLIALLMFIAMVCSCAGTGPGFAK